ncbi:PAS domain S-box-containing protein [Aestuariispira insulae]|uniref:histidine kinase n=2 Tax=Aestuariispira insulae TaxID=1461337 RepID=A0A3D9HY23_9PROT|nr:PAS domain S-box-containing protein [Aestuariispira insulae]
MEAHGHIPETEAIGTKLSVLFPDHEAQGLCGIIDQVIEKGKEVTLPDNLQGVGLPLFTKQSCDPRNGRMRQKIHLSPCGAPQTDPEDRGQDSRSEPGEYCLIQIHDMGAPLTDNKPPVDEEEPDRYQTILSDQPTIIFRFDRHGTISYANRNFADFVGRPLSELHNARLEDVLPREFSERLTGSLAKLHWQHPITIEEFCHIEQDGRRQWYQWVDRCLCDEHGEIIEYQSVGEDISDLKETHRALEESRLQIEEQADLLRTLNKKYLAEKIAAEEANKSKTHFLAHMSHELRTPLNAIIGFSELLKQQALGPLTPPDYQEYATIIHDSGNDLLTLVNNILDLSRLEANRMALDIHPVDLQNTVESAMKMLAGLANENKITLDFTIKNPIESLMADGPALKRMIVNLLSNAIKFTAEGGTVELAYDRDEDNVTYISVSDTGVGMTEEDIRQALQPFRQVSHGLSRKYDGSGLGLPLVRSLAEMHQGKMTIESEKGKGTRVTLIFPPYQPPKPDSHIPRPKLQQGPKPPEEAESQEEAEPSKQTRHSSFF